MSTRALLSFAVLATFVSVGGAACTTIKGENDDGGLAPDGAPIDPGGDGGVRDGGGDGGSSITDYGSISLTYADYGTVKSFMGFAQFQRAAGVTPSLPSCQSETEGECVSYVCAPFVQAEAGTTIDAGSPTPPNAGVISVSGARIPAGTKLTPGTDGKYPALQQSGLDAWSGGETLSISAVGAEVPAFSGTVTAPAPSVALTSPAISTTQKAEIDRSKALAVAWSGAGAGTLTVSATASVPGGGSAVVTCRFDASKGTGQMPTKLLAKLPAGDGGFGASISTTEQVKAGSYTVTLLGSSSVKNASGQVTLK
jgi:hypothetical protein